MNIAEYITGEFGVVSVLPVTIMMTLNRNFLGLVY